METPPINEEDNMMQYDDLFVGRETLWNFKGAEQNYFESHTHRKLRVNWFIFKSASD